MKNNIKLIVGIIIGFVLSSGVVYALTLYQASEVAYDNSNSGTDKTEVQSAIDELYSMSQNHCPENYECIKQYGKELLISKANDISVINYDDGNKSEMYTFYHASTDHANTLLDYRYIGNVPNNYISFNDETWRIIGVLDGKIKIIKDEPIGNLILDYKRNGVGSSIGYGSNDWTDAQLMYMLNPDSYSLNSGYKLDGNYIRDNKNNIIYQLNCIPAMVNTNASSYSCTTNNWKLNDKSLSEIEKTTWYLSGNDLLTISADTFYQRERGTRVYSGRQSLWEGNVGLLYPSDYLYTYAYGVDDVCYQNGDKCSSLQGGKPGNGWLYTGSDQWTITQFTMYGWYHIYISTYGGVSAHDARTARQVRPCVYLKSDVMLSGSGTEDDPYVIVK